MFCKHNFKYYSGGTRRVCAECGRDEFMLYHRYGSIRYEWRERKILSPKISFYLKFKLWFKNLLTKCKL